MAIDIQNYIVTREVAIRAGGIKTKYRTRDGRFITDNRALASIQFTSDEIVNGLQGVEKITLDEAKRLIAKADYKMGDEPFDKELIEESEETEESEEHEADSEDAKKETETTEEEE